MFKIHKKNHIIIHYNMSQLSDDERMNLKKLMNEMDYEDNTETIRRLKHSSKIRNDMRKLEELNMTNFYTIIIRIFLEE